MMSDEGKEKKDKMNVGDSSEATLNASTIKGSEEAVISAKSSSVSNKKEDLIFYYFPTSFSSQKVLLISIFSCIQNHTKYN